MIGLAVAGGALALLIALVFLLGGNGQEEPTVSVNSSPSTVTSFVSGIPKPNAQQTEDLLYGLRKIDPELDRARSIDRARNTCSDLLAGKKRDQVVENTRLRFDGVAQIDTADAEKIVALVEQGGWCEIG
ncbi:hypothetical protein ACFQ08_31875 [Streptosporangium algeriense]|uniref:DUF732 domain-containing protein n=1 Tax=Streptosporangium algeriense TaxID=1682748 RepID=A0ABW3E1L6_9ACTN